MTTKIGVNVPRGKK